MRNDKEDNAKQDQKDQGNVQKDEIKIQVSNEKELLDSLNNDKVTTIELKSDITLNNFAGINLKNKTIIGNLILNSNENGVLNIENGTIEGNVTVNAPNATVNNKAVIKGDAIIKDVSGHTFNNLGTVNNIIIEDINVSSLFNNGIINGKIKIVKSANVPFTLKGNISCEVSIESVNAKVKVDNSAKIKALVVIGAKAELQVGGTVANIQFHKGAEKSELQLNKDSKIESIKVDADIKLTGDGIKNLKEDKVTGSKAQGVKEEVKKVQQVSEEEQQKQQQQQKQEEEKQKKKLADIQSVQKVKDKLNLANLNSITSNLNLPVAGENGVVIAWKSNNSSVVSENGKVTRPKATEGDISLTLTATLTKGEAKETKDFIVTVKAKDFTDEELVANSLKDLNLQGNLNCIVDNIKLSVKDDKNNVSIAWKSNNETVVSNNGVVTRTEKDENVILTATLTKGTVSKTKEFKITVKAKEKDVQAALKLIADSLKLDNQDNIENDIQLQASLDDANITWKSSNEGIVSSTGKVTRPGIGKQDAKVVLTATISKDGKSVTKDFRLTVKAEKELVANNKEEFYNILKNALGNCETTVKVKVLNYNNSDYKLDIINQIVTEHPEVDYGKPASEAQIYSYGGQERVLEINLKYRKDAAIVKQQKETTKNEVQSVINKVIKPGMTDVEKEIALHDYIVKNADYDSENYRKNTTTLEDHTAYGVLVNHLGVCESYAKAMYELLNEVGIECKYVTGYSKHDGKKGGGHAWNMVKLDNEWYNLDTTWDDPVSDRNGTASLNKDDDADLVSHGYFNVTDDVLNKDHIRGEFESSHPELYPSCTATKYAYNNLDIDEYTNDGKLIEKVTSKDELDAKILNSLNNKEKALYLRFKGFTMTQTDLSNEVKEVANKNHIGGFNWSTGAQDDYHVKYKFTW